MFRMYCDDFIQMKFSVSEYKANRLQRRLDSIRKRDCDICERENKALTSGEFSYIKCDHIHI